MIVRKALAVAAAVLVALCQPSPKADAWGPEGHRIVARIAELNLSPKAMQALADLLPDTAFSNSTSISDSRLPSYADFVRHNSM